MVSNETDPNPREALTAALRGTASHIPAGEDRRSLAILEYLAELGYVVQPGPELQAAIDRTGEPCNSRCPAQYHHHGATPDATADGYDWPDVEQVRAEHTSIALEAHDAVYGDRQADYGHPREDFTRTAILWTGLLQHLLAEGAYIEASDIGRCMIAVKLSRDVNAPKRDNRVDMAGYAITLDRLETGK